MDEAPKYPVGTIFEMAAIPPDARPRFLAELPDMLSTIDNLLAVNKAFEGVAKIDLQTPVWVDDDKGTRTINMVSKDPDVSMSFTGKIKADAA